MAKVIHLELTPVYKTNYLVMEMEKESWITNVDNSDDDENWKYWQNWNNFQKWSAD